MNWETETGYFLGEKLGEVGRKLISRKPFEWKGRYDSDGKES